MKTRKEVVQQIVDWSEDNTSGTILSKKAIQTIVRQCCNNPFLFKDDLDIMNTTAFVEHLITENESTRGFLVKTSDVLQSLQLDDQQLDDHPLCMEGHNCPYFKSKGSSECIECDL